MRYLLLFVTLFYAHRALASDQSLVRVGEEVDYVASAIARIPGADPVPGLTSSAIGSRFGGGEKELIGWDVRLVDPAENTTIPSMITLHLIDILRKEGWTTSDTPLSPTEALSPTQFWGDAHKEEERLVITLTVFPSQDGVLRISYSQRRMGKKAA